MPSDTEPFDEYAALSMLNSHYGLSIASSSSYLYQDISSNLYSKLVIFLFYCFEADDLNLLAILHSFHSNRYNEEADRLRSIATRLKLLSARLECLEQKIVKSPKMKVKSGIPDPK